MAKPNLILGDCLEVLKTFPDNSFDAIVTDPPAGISFMNKSWDHDKGGRDQWIAWLAEIMKECLRVLKPGGHGFVWALPRTSHWTGIALEDAGFEIRDRVVHIFGSGFPKSASIPLALDKQFNAIGDRGEAFCTAGAGERKDIQGVPGAYGMSYDTPITDAAKQYNGFGTALKPAIEDYWLIRKPLSESTIAKNVLKYGTGGINIDACRVGVGEKVPGDGKSKRGANSGGVYGDGEAPENAKPHTMGRWPANLILGCACDGEVHDPDCVVVMLDKQSGVSKSTGGRTANISKTSKIYGNGKGLGQNKNVEDVRGDPGLGDCGGASRFFYCVKASKAERGEGNVHPTVKPLKLMRYLCKLVTPTNGHVLDLFMGSGTTGLACQAEGFAFTGIEQSPEYLQVAWNRLCKAK